METPGPPENPTRAPGSISRGALPGMLAGFGSISVPSCKVCARRSDLLPKSELAVC